MYCFIKYAEFDEKRREEYNSRTFDEQAIKSYNSVKSSPSKLFLHENKTLTVNSDCYVQILLDYVASEIKFDKNSNFDFCDETGRLLSVKNLRPWQSAATVLDSQKTYFVVLYETEDDAGQYTLLEPILNQYGKEYFDLIGKLKKFLPSVKRLSNDRRSLRRRSADGSTSKAKLTSRASLLQETETLIRRKSSSKSASSQRKSGALKKISKDVL